MIVSSQLNYTKTIGFMLLFCQLLKKVLEQHSYVLNSEKLSVGEKEYFRQMTTDMDEKDAPLVLYQLCDFLYRYYGKKPIILLDEYDTPMQEAYATSFVFTEEEVFASLDEYGYSDQKQLVHEWFAEPERFYHGFVLGLMVDLQTRYSITSNRESGFGQYDVMLEPKKKDSDDCAYILEFKVHSPKKEADLEATVAAALAQIEEKRSKRNMNTTECIKTRRSIRTYQEKAVSPELVREVVATARFAPSWKNTQTARYYVVQDAALKQKIAESCVLGFTYNTGTLVNAPALVVLAYVEKRSGYERDGSYTTPKENAWEMFDAGIAAQTFCLAAHEKGLGTCIMGIFDDAAVAKAISLPEGQRVGALIALGFPAEEPQAPARKETEQLVQFL